MAKVVRPKTWSIEPHTEAKHRILAAYLRAWFPILSLGGFSRVIYIDGFAGPGRYSDGQAGSPVLALQALADQTLALPSCFEFHFVEREAAVVASLESALNDLKAQGRIAHSAEIHIHGGVTFEEAYDREIRQRLASHSSAPTFALVDPFGWTGIPMRIVADLLRRPRTEVLINFMFEEINRFLAHPDQCQNFDALFGDAGWRNACNMQGRLRTRCIHDFYKEQLHTLAEAKYVRSFEMRNERHLTDYFLFFATNSLKGLSKMKEAMWRVDPAGGFSFSDATDPAQTTLFAGEPDRKLLRRLLTERFVGTSVRVDDIERYVLEETPYLSTHYKKVLKDLEKDARLSAVGAPPSRKLGTFPDQKMILEFV